MRAGFWGSSTPEARSTSCRWTDAGLQLAERRRPIHGRPGARPSSCSPSHRRETMTATAWARLRTAKPGLVGTVTRAWQSRSSSRDNPPRSGPNTTASQARGALRDQLPGLGRRQHAAQLPGAGRGGGQHQVGVADRLAQRCHGGHPHDLVPAHRHAQEILVLVDGERRLHEHQLGDPEVPRHADRGTHVAGVPRPHQHDPHRHGGIVAAPPAQPGKAQGYRLKAQGPPPSPGRRRLRLKAQVATAHPGQADLGRVGEHLEP